MWFEIKYIPIHTNSQKKKEREKIRNINYDNLINLAREKARELNEHYNFPKDEKMVTIQIGNIETLRNVRV